MFNTLQALLGANWGLTMTLMAVESLKSPASAVARWLFLVGLAPIMFMLGLTLLELQHRTEGRRHLWPSSPTKLWALFGLGAQVTLTVTAASAFLSHEVQVALLPVVTYSVWVGLLYFRVRFA